MGNFLRKVNSFFFFNFTKKISKLKIINRGIGFGFFFLTKNFLSIHLRPKYNSDFKLRTVSVYKKNYFAIIIQGPIDNNINFLCETIKIYKKIFPKCLIVLSTWLDEKKHIKKLNKLGINCLFNEFPESKGLGNINYQLKSTYEGIEFARKKGSKYILKTRTDCRIQKPNVLDSFIGILKNYPPKKNSKVKKRILASSIATCKYRVYGLTDICLFGTTYDLKKYFNFQTENEIFKKYKFPVKKIINEVAIKSEILLCARYLLAIGEDLKWNLRDWWHHLKSYFLIFSSYEIDFFWKKYEWRFEQRLMRSYGYKSNRLVEFSDWLHLYNTNINKLGWDRINYKEKWKIADGIIKKKSIY